MPPRRPSASTRPTAAALAGALILAALAWWLVADDPPPGSAEPLRPADAIAPRGPSLPTAAPRSAQQPLRVDAAAVDDAPPDGAAAETALPPGVVTYHVTGRVVDERGAPWIGAVVRSVPDEATGEALGIETHSYSLDLDALASTTTDHEGRFTLDGPWAPGRESERVFRQQPSPVLIVDAEGMALHTFPLSHHDGLDRDLGDLVVSMPAASIVARLVDDSGAPIAGARAGIFSWGPSELAKQHPSAPDARAFNIMGLAHGESDADGHVEIDRLWPCSCRLSFSHVDHVTRQVQDVAVGPGQRVWLGDVLLERGGHIAGVVRDEQGAPIAGAEVWVRNPTFVHMRDAGRAQPEDWERADVLSAVIDQLHDSRAWSNEQAPVTSASDGRFDRSALSGERRDVYVEAPGYEPLRVVDVPVGSTQLELVLAPETNLDVLVVDDATGQPVPSSSLQAFRWVGPLLYSHTSPALARRVSAGQGPGTYLVHTIGPQGTRLVASAPGYGTHLAFVPGTDTQADTQADTEIDTEIDTGTGTAAGATAGTGTLTAAAPGGPAPVTLRLQQECILEGRIEDEAGAPVENARVTLRRAAPDDDDDDDERRDRGEHPLDTHSAADGGFRFERLERGPVSLVVRCAGFQDPEPLELELAPGELLSAPPIVLRRACAITGTLTRADGTPAAGLQVSALRPEPSRGSSSVGAFATVDHVGAFALTGLTPGTYTVSVGERRVPRPYLELTITLAEGTSQELALVLPAPTVVRGRVTSGGRPLPDGQVRAREQRQEPGLRALSASQECDEDGGFVLTLAIEGRYRVQAERPGGGYSQAVEVDAVQGQELLLDFELGAASIAGALVDADEGTPVPGAEVHLLRDGAPASAWIPADDAGAFRIDPLLPGTYVLQARSDAYPLTTREDALTLAAGEARSPVVLPMTKGAGIEGVVLDTNGEPDGAWLFLVTPGDPPTIADLGAPDGHFHFEGLPAGRHRVVASRPGYDYAILHPEPGIDIRSLEDAALDVELAPGEHRQVTLQKLR